jgi:hypothetical protein
VFRGDLTWAEACSASDEVLMRVIFVMLTPIMYYSERIISVGIKVGSGGIRLGRKVALLGLLVCLVCLFRNKD